MAKQTKASVGNQYDVENIMGMFVLAFGQGVDPLHVHRTVIRTMRDTFLPPIQTVVLKDPTWDEQWKAESATVLGWMEAVGCLAAQIAMEPKDRRTVVGVPEFVTALASVIAEHKATKVSNTPFGKWCQ